MARTTLEIDGRTWTKCDCCGRYFGKHYCKHCFRGFKTPKTLAAHEALCFYNLDRRVVHKCRFCGRVYHTEKPLGEHEPICYLNPNRKCPDCDGSGEITECIGIGYYHHYDCHSCVKTKERREEAGWVDGKPPTQTPQPNRR